MHPVEHRPPEEGGTEQPSAEIYEKTERECFDVDGKLLCRIVSEVETSEEGLRRLRTLFVTSPDGARSVDVLSLVGLPQDGDQEQIVNLDPAYFYKIYESCVAGVAVPDGPVMVRGVDNPVEIGILLHELGHAAQFRDEETKPVSDLHNQILRNRLLNPVWPPRAILEQIFSAVPEARAFADEPAVQEYLALHEKMEATRRALDELQAELDLVEARQAIMQTGKLQGLIIRQSAEYKELEKQKDELAKRRADFIRQFTELALDQIPEAGRQAKIARITLLPLRMMERNANKRAYLWMRAVKAKTGVDLLRTKVPWVSPGTRIETVTSAQEFLEQGVKDFHRARLQVMRSNKSSDNGADETVA